MDFTVDVVNRSTLTLNQVKLLYMGEVQVKCAAVGAWGIQPEEQKLAVL